LPFVAFPLCIEIVAQVVRSWLIVLICALIKLVSIIRYKGS
jgi:hypothetical protein